MSYSWCREFIQRPLTVYSTTERINGFFFFLVICVPTINLVFRSSYWFPNIINLLKNSAFRQNVDTRHTHPPPTHHIWCV